MYVLTIMLLVPVLAERDPATEQLIYFKERTKGPVGALTTASGAAVTYDEAFTSFNTKLINNEHFMDLITHVNRERRPERIVHAKGTGAFGYFEVTHDISHICKADFLKKVGKKTPVATRFSTAIGEKGSSDLAVDVRGFAIKFYTAEGNFDIAGFNTPVTFFKDPLHFTYLGHAVKKNPATNLYDPNSLWDALTLLPAALLMFSYIFADRTAPISFINMPGYGIHTYQVENERGDQHFVRFHFTPDAGFKTFNTEEARNISAMDPDYLTRDLFRSIGNGECPSWTVNLQILTKSDVKKEGSAVFDVTRIIPLDKYPLHPIGKFYLNRNAKNHFAEIEQLAFCPANLVRGIYGGPDKMYESRRLAYRDAQYYRLGANFKKIPVNCPLQSNTFTYIRNGNPQVNDNGGDVPNYYPNSFHGPVPFVDKPGLGLINVIESPPDNFDQVADFYENDLTEDERAGFIKNIVFSLQAVTAKIVKDRALKIFKIIHPDLGARVARGLNATCT